MRIKSLVIALFIGLVAMPLAVVEAQSGRDVTLILSPRQTTVAAGDQIQVDLFLNNPSKQSLTSVESLISYDATALRGVSVAYPQDTPFEMNLLSTGESEFNAGQIRLSRATLKDTSLLPDTKYSFATLTFEVTASGGTAVLDFIKTQSGIERVTANATVEGISTNVMNLDSLAPVTLTVSGTHSSASTTSSGTTVSNIFSNSNSNSTSTTNLNTNTGNQNSNVIPVSTTSNLNSNFASVSNSNTNGFSTVTTTTTTSTTTNLNTNMTVATLDAPRDVAIKKDGKQITLYWTNDDIARKTYIYYGTSPDSFTTRKSIEYPSNSFTFNSMATKGNYYFVLTHENAVGAESAYTPMFVVDGTKSSIYYENDSYLTKISDRGSLRASNVTTMGISDKARASLLKVPTMPENGPAEMVLLLFLLSLGGAAFFSTRRHSLLS